MQPVPHPRGSQGVPGPPAPRPVRPLMQQSNQFVKRLTLVGIHMKQAREPSLGSEVVKETLIQFFGFLTDRVLDYTLTTLSRAASQQDEMGIADIQQFCSDHLGYDPSPITTPPSAPNGDVQPSATRPGTSQALNLSMYRRKGKLMRFRRLDPRKVGVTVFKRSAATKY